MQNHKINDKFPATKKTIRLFSIKHVYFYSALGLFSISIIKQGMSVYICDLASTL